MPKIFKKPLFSFKEKRNLAITFLAIFPALFIDDSVLRWVASWRIHPLDAFMLFMTDFGMLFAILVLAAFLLLNKKYRDFTLILLTSATALEVSYLLKVLFQTPRPFAAAIVATIPLTQASGFSMPSLHTAFCFSVWPFVEYLFSKKSHQLIAKITLITIAFTRLYLSVHYLSDILAGAIIGYTIAKLWLYFEKEYQVIEWFKFHVKDKFELRRQLAHIFIGSTIIFLIKLGLINEGILLIIAIIGGILSITCRFYKIPFLEHILNYFERPADRKNFPGKGSFFMVLGCYLSLKFFQKDVAMAAIAIMTVGDALTTIVGTYFGKIKNPLNPKKHLEGTVIAIVVSTLAAFFFVDFPKAFLASSAALVVELFLHDKVTKILDDNIIVPLVAGIVIMLV